MSAPPLSRLLTFGSAALIALAVPLGSGGACASTRPAGAAGSGAAQRTAAVAAIASRPVVVRSGVWFLRSSLTSGTATTQFSYGPAGAYPLSGDWNGDGVPTPGVVVGNVWSLRNSNSAGAADVTVRYGDSGDVPVVGDWDGNGTDTPGVVRGNTWYLSNGFSGSADVVLRFGDAGDTPVVGDWDGNGSDTPGVVRKGMWYLSNTLAGGAAPIAFAYGDPADRPVVGDWDGNGTTTVGVVRSGHWLLTDTSPSHAAGIDVSYGSAYDVSLSSTSALARAPGGAVAPNALRGKDISVLPTSAKVVALTFDAGANADAVASIRSTLASRGVPATFFLTGDWVRSYPVQARDLALLYPVGNHTDSHQDLTTLTSDAAVTAQIRNGASAVSGATRYDTHPLFRFPFGARDARTLNLMAAQGYVGVRWTVDTLGWEGTSGGQSVATILQRVRSSLQPGMIILMHVGSHPTDHSTLDADALPQLITLLQLAGYGFVTVPQTM